MTTARGKRKEGVEEEEDWQGEEVVMHEYSFGEY